MSQTITLELPDAVFAVVQQAATDCKLSPTEWLYAGLVLTWYESEARLYTESKDAADAEFKAELRAMGPWGRLGKGLPSTPPLTVEEARTPINELIERLEDSRFSCYEDSATVAEILRGWSINGLTDEEALSLASKEFDSFNYFAEEEVEEELEECVDA